MWRRLPTYFPNIRLIMLPLTDVQKQHLNDYGWIREVAFKTEPRINKLELKAFLEQLHGMSVERISTINYQGKRKRIIDDNGTPHYRRLTDWKKAYVIFKPPQITDPPENTQNPELVKHVKAGKEQRWQSKKDEQQRQEEQQRQQQELRQRARQGLLPSAAQAAADQAAAAATQQ